MVDDQRPPQPGARKHPVLLVGSPPGEGYLLPRYPPGSRRRGGYGRPWRGVARAYRDSLVQDVGLAPTVAHPEPNAEVLRPAVGAGRLRFLGVVVGPVAVEVSRVAEAVAVAVAAPGGVELHPQGEAAVGSACLGLRHGRSVTPQVLYAADRSRPGVYVEEVSFGP